MKAWSAATVGIVGGIVVGGAVLELQGRIGSRDARPRSVSVERPRPIFSDDAESVIQPANYVVAEAAPPQRLADERPELTSDEAAVRAVIDRELKDASPDERQIFFDELKGLPPGIVEDMLHVRRQFGVGKPKQPLGVWQNEIVKTPGLSPPAVEPVAARLEWAATVRAMQRAREIHLHNLANVNSPGYQRLVPQTSPVSTPSQSTNNESNAWGSRTQGVRLDVSQGEIVETQRMLDVAIRGAGWFAVQTPSGLAFTRNGHLSLNAERQLCATTAHGLLPLEPAVRLPAAVVALVIWPDGSIGAPGEESRGQHGQIRLADLADPSLLTYHADGLLHAPPGQTSLQFVEPTESRRPLSFMHLERSNVDADVEWRAIKQIDRWLEAVAR